MVKRKSVSLLFCLTTYVCVNTDILSLARAFRLRPLRWLLLQRVQGLYY